MSERLADMAELARLTAIELRKRGIHAVVRHPDFPLEIWVPAYHPSTGGSGLQWSPYPPKATHFDNLTPTECAGVIQQLESAKAREWAGDK